MEFLNDTSIFLLGSYLKNSPSLPPSLPPSHLTSFQASAQGGITDVNGKIIGGQEVVVEPFKRGHKVEALWTNLYVKNVPLDWDDARFKVRKKKREGGREGG